MSRYKAYPAYRDTETKWLGVIPSNWNLFDGKRLFSSRRESAREGDEQLAASQKYGVVPQSLMMEMNDAKVMLALKGTSSFRHVGKNDFVISLRSFEGGIEHSSYVGCVSPAYTVLQAEKAVVPAYFKYLLKSGPYIAALQASTDSLRDGKSISFEQFGAIALPYPAGDEQAAIATFLDHETTKIDALIEKQQRLIELLKEKRQAVISHAVTKGLNPNAPMKDSGVEWLGEVPAHWEVKRMKYSVQVFEQGWSPQCDSRPAEGEEFGVLKVGCVNGGIFNPDENKALPSELLPQTQYVLRKGDFLISRANTRDLVGSAAVVEDDFDKLILCDKLYRLRFSLNINPHLLSFYLTISSVRQQIELGASGASDSMQNISQSIIKELQVLIPPAKEAEILVDQIKNRLSKFDQIHRAALQQVVFLHERRTALISAAVTGKIDVRDWQAAA